MKRNRDFCMDEMTQLHLEQAMAIADCKLRSKTVQRRREEVEKHL